MSDARLATFLADAQKALAHLQNEFSRLQTGRANAAIFEHIEVDAYGQRQQLRAVAGVSVTDARTIVVQPWDRAILQDIEKALQQANIGSNPVNDGMILRITLPSMTTERREQLKKLVHQLAEETKIVVRKLRQTTHDVLKTEKDEDIRTTLQEQLQKEVDAINVKIVELAKKKEEDIMTV